MNKDEEHLKLLSIFHYIVGGIAALSGCFPIIHLVIGIAMLLGAFGGGAGQGPPKIVGVMFVGLALGLMVFFWALGICLIVAGCCLWKKRRYMFCLVMAAINCAFMPFGTVLGVFTIIVLMRDSVKELFAAKKGAELRA